MSSIKIATCSALIVCASLCLAQEDRQSVKGQEAAIRSFFSSLKIALADDRQDVVVSSMSPDAFTLLEGARKVAFDPDNVTEDAPSQFEVIAGLQLRLLLQPNRLKSMDTDSLFKWSLRNGVVELRGLAAVDLRDIQVDGDHATASLGRGPVAITNTVVCFELDKGEWKLDLRTTLLVAEDLFRTARKMGRVTKLELAVLTLQRAYQRQIPELQELLLSPAVRTKVSELKDKKPSAIYDTVVSELSAGRQRDAENMLKFFVDIHTNDQRLAFVQAVCKRSRFAKIEAGRQFRRVFDMDPRTIEGKCARYVLTLDDGKHVEDSFKGLTLLAEENPDNPFLLWLIGIQCRDYYRRTDKKDRGAPGAAAYRKLLELFDVGPVLVHQTFANILTEELDLYEEALEHRRIAVKLEPKAWTYQGLANTLSAMKRYDEANETFVKLMEIDPNDASYWHSWAISLNHEKKWAECAEKCKKALENDPGYYKASKSWGYALEMQGKLEEALEKYEDTIQMHPVHPYAYEGAARVLRRLGEPAKAEAFLRKREVATPAPRKAKKRRRHAVAPVMISPSAVTMNVDTERSFAVFHGLSPYSFTVKDTRLGSVVANSAATNEMFGVHHTYTYRPTTAQRSPVVTNYVLVQDARSNSTSATIIQWK